MKDLKFDLIYFIGIMAFAACAGVLIGRIGKKNESETIKFDVEYHILVQENELLYSKNMTLDREVTIYKSILIPAYDSLLNANGITPTAQIKNYKQMLHYK